MELTGVLRGGAGVEQRWAGIYDLHGVESTDLHGVGSTNPTGFATRMMRGTCEYCNSGVLWCFAYAQSSLGWNSRECSEVELG